jgi:hypothetical protein
VRNTTFYGENRKCSGLKVPSQCPFVQLLKISSREGNVFRNEQGKEMGSDGASLHSMGILALGYGGFH